MKTILYTTAWTIIAALALCSCDSRQEQSIERRTVVTYTVKFSQDAFDAIDMVLTYKDKGGINAVDTVRDTLWTKTVVLDVLPAKVGLNWSVSPKAASHIGKDSLDLCVTYAMDYDGRTICGGLPFISYHKFPTSRLATLCDYINLKRENLAQGRSKKYVYHPCFILSEWPKGEEPINAEEGELRSDMAPWLDEGQ